MKVISLLQPWATLVVIGAKKIETRSWQTKYRGPLLIHASVNKKMAKEFCSSNINCKNPFSVAGHWLDLPYGAIIGKVDLVSIVPSSWCRLGEKIEWTGPNDKLYKFELTEHERAFGDYSENRYGWLLDNFQQFKIPVPAKGQLSIWETTPEIDLLITKISNVL